MQVQRHVQQSQGAVERALQCFSTGGHSNGDVSRSSPVQLASGEGKGPAPAACCNCGNMALVVLQGIACSCHIT